MQHDMGFHGLANERNMEQGRLDLESYSHSVDCVRHYPTTYVSTRTSRQIRVLRESS